MNDNEVRSERTGRMRRKFYSFKSKGGKGGEDNQ